MAKISYAAPVDAIRGTVNGLIFSANQAGPYIRRRQNFQKRQTIPRQNAQLALADFSTQWATITSGQRADWNTWAALAAQEKTDSLGNAYYISGFASFVMCNINRAYWHSTLQAAAPPSLTPAAAYWSNWIAEDDAGTPLIGGRTTNVNVPPREVVLHLAVRRSSEAITNSASFFSIPIDGDVGATYTWWYADSDVYASLFGPPDASHRIFFRGFTQREEGNRSGPQESWLDYTP